MAQGVFSKLTLEHPDQGAQYGGAATFFVFLYTATFGATWLTVPWLCKCISKLCCVPLLSRFQALLTLCLPADPAEIFPLQVRAKGQGWGVVGWSIGFATTTMLIPLMFNGPWFLYFCSRIQQRDSS